VCDLETSRMGAPYIYDISRLRVKLLVIMKEKKSQCDRILKIQSLRISHKKGSGKRKGSKHCSF